MNSRLALSLLGILMLACSNHALAQYEKKPWPPHLTAPAIDYTELSGQLWDRQLLKGKVVVINFWASWCAPCIEEMPSLQRLQESIPKNQLIVLTINHKETPIKIRNFNQRNGFTLPVIADQQGNIAKSWGIKIFPSTIVLSPHNQPLWSIEGSTDWASDEWIGLLNATLEKE